MREKINMADLARRIDPRVTALRDDLAKLKPEGEPTPRDYAPPAVRQVGPTEKVIDTVQSFGSMPTKEIDDVITAAEQELARLKHAAAEVQRDYLRRTTQLVADLNRMREGVRLSMETMKALREQCHQLNARDVTPEEIERDE